ncbi:hypothetical protein P175DRAFT_0529656 [Aspergillus ochraceoroseus IBT 24754]|uniref:Uncharacterized protein n=1 Tax=Aspergillus ochraceoroseus IBT 24754 TaxID=1392256 RepID=A0A2T5M224_9EURO|nr:uncharacterized protein P175DRAFT_0529656 [Aspergillus ochraceoroseus IBT 24754]PTU22590.1 hypothetical protein P175DRAFT_0529656 [Aspergillus ochraceoroseus IBT 24754]
MFGDEVAVTTLPQNGLSRHHKIIESLLDKGEIAVIPVPGKMTAHCPDNSRD